MGIRFFCPNGHKLHVKSFQAGHKGICPYCGATIEIPLTSTRGSSKSSGTEKSGRPTNTPGVEAETVNLNAIGPGVTPCSGNPAGYDGSFVSNGADQEIELSAPLDRQVSVPTAPTASIASDVVLPTSGGLSPINSAPQSAPQMPTSAAQPVDPFAEAPTAVWYVRPASGGQYGPASGDIMKSWLDEGRVANDSLVWREGWPDWKEASAVFEQLAPVQFNFNITAKSTPSEKRQEKTERKQATAKQEETYVSQGNSSAGKTQASVSHQNASGSPNLHSILKDPRNIVIAAQTTIIMILILIMVFK